MTDSTPKQADTKERSKRSKILIGVLACLSVALAYDYTVARTGVASAYDKISTRSEELNARSTEVFTDQDVQQLLSDTPSRTFDDTNGDRVEVYSWQSGLPFRTHDLFVVYKPNEGRNLFYRHAKFAYETSGQVSPFSVPMVVEVDPDSPFLNALPEGEDNDPRGARPSPEPAASSREPGIADSDTDGDATLKQRADWISDVAAKGAANEDDVEPNEADLEGSDEEQGGHEPPANDPSDE